jgi:hypothetical protein
MLVADPRPFVLFARCRNPPHSSMARLGRRSNQIEGSGLVPEEALSPRFSLNYFTTRCYWPARRRADAIPTRDVYGPIRGAIVVEVVVRHSIEKTAERTGTLARGANIFGRFPIASLELETHHNQWRDRLRRCLIGSIPPVRALPSKQRLPGRSGRSGHAKYYLVGEISYGLFLIDVLNFGVKRRASAAFWSVSLILSRLID